MKIYLASSFSLIPKIERVANMLETMDHEITVKWWSRVYQTEGGQLVETPDLKKLYAHLPPDEFYDMPETIRSYIADVQGITEADALVLVGPDKASRGALVGANIELGIALGLGKPCYGLGAFVNSAMYWSLNRCQTFGELSLKLLEGDQ